MPIRLADLQERTRKITVDFQGDSFEVEYRINVATPQFFAEVEQYQDWERILYQIERIVERWEVLDDAGNEVPPKREVLERMPATFLAAVLTAIGNDMSLGEEAKKG